MSDLIIPILITLLIIGLVGIAQVIGIAVMQLLVEKREPSREALIEMIQVLWQGEQVDLAVELALDVLMPREE
ncbi:hypothetical protein I0Q38_26600 [Klebsiella pneumoniae]|nr:hypothetical protein [Klebsiella pneumoniae]